MDINGIFKHNEEWVSKQLQEDSNYFEKLSQGQNPKYLFIGCSDSRVSADIIMAAKPGDVFIHRNIANLVPNNDLNVLSVINYSVNHLRVSDVVVCGHYNCGGVKVAMKASDEGLLNPWLRHIRDVYRLYKNELSAIEDIDDRYDRLVELNVKEQCINLIKTRDVQKALQEERIQVHGWVFDLKTGKLIDLKIDFEKIKREIMDVYNLFD
ncbi:MAG: carbonic anhydrase [Bacteroidales bacterium]|nr:carbonic anhydrase [Bacteroidales bacterium]